MTLDRSRIRSRTRAARRDREALARAQTRAWSATIAAALADNRPTFRERLLVRLRRLVGRG